MVQVPTRHLPTIRLVTEGSPKREREKHCHHKIKFETI